MKSGEVETGLSAVVGRRGKKPIRLVGKLLILALSLVPLAVLVSFVASYNVDMPFGDEWTIHTSLLEKSYRGTLTFPDLWSPKFEHRLFFTNALILLLARLSGWNIPLENAVSILLAMAILGMVAYQIRKTTGSLGLYGVPWIIPAVSLMIFSLSQWENWFWGMCLGYFLNILAVVAGIVLLAGPGFRWGRYLAALLLAFIAAHTGAYGLTYLPIALLGIAYSPHPKKLKLLLMGVWALGSAMIVFSYFYQLPASPSGLLILLDAPLEVIYFVFSYLGAPIITRGFHRYMIFYHRSAFYAGLSGCIIALALIWSLVRFRKIAFFQLVPYLSLILYALGGAFMVSVGRLVIPDGERYALASRYVTISSLFWISNLVFLYLFYRSSRSKMESGIGGIVQRSASLLLLAAIVVLVSLNSIQGARVYREYMYGNYLLPVRKSIISGKTDRLVRTFIPPPRHEKIDFLKRYHLSLFRDRID